MSCRVRKKVSSYLIIPHIVYFLVLPISSLIFLNLVVFFVSEDLPSEFSKCKGRPGNWPLRPCMRTELLRLLHKTDAEKRKTNIYFGRV